jgi:hypothetical protein
MIGLSSFLPPAFARIMCEARPVKPLQFTDAQKPQPSHDDWGFNDLIDKTCTAAGLAEAREPDLRAEADPPAF